VRRVARRCVALRAERARDGVVLATAIHAMGHSGPLAGTSQPAWPAPDSGYARGGSTRERRPPCNRQEARSELNPGLLISSFRHVVPCDRVGEERSAGPGRDRGHGGWSLSPRLAIVAEQRRCSRIADAGAAPPSRQPHRAQRDQSESVSPMSRAGRQKGVLQWMASGFRRARCVGGTCPLESCAAGGSGGWGSRSRHRVRAS
jgi:hypothetical protein